MRAGMLKNPKNFREIVLADLYRGQRLVEKVHPDPIDPQFRIATGSVCRFARRRASV